VAIDHDKGRRNEMTNMLEDQDRFTEELDSLLLRARLARFGLGAVSDEHLLAASMDCADTAAALTEWAAAFGDAAASVKSADRPAVSLTAGQFRTEMSDSLTKSMDWNATGAAMLRDIGAALARFVEDRREARIKAAKDRERDAMNRTLLARLKAETQTPEALAAKFNELYNVQLAWEPSLEDRVAQRHNAAEREAIDQGRELND
jgi:hypothetical protein